MATVCCFLRFLAFCTISMLSSSETVFPDVNTIPSPPPAPPSSSSSNIFMEYAATMGKFLNNSVYYVAENIFQTAINLDSLLSPNSRLITPIEMFDYIVVGGGAAGSPAARTLAEGLDNKKNSVLLIERGHARSKKDTPNAMDIYGAGVGINDPEISQLLITSQGVRSHIGAVMGGGTSINMAIAISETNKYFDFIEETYPGVKWDRQLIYESNSWVASRVFSAMPITEGYARSWIQGLSDQGFRPNNGFRDGVPSLTPSDLFETGYTWQGTSLFNASDAFFRSSADVLIGGSKAMPEDPPKPDTLKILTKHTVLRVEFDVPVKEHLQKKGTGFIDASATSPTSLKPRANCVIMRRAVPADTAPINSRAPTALGKPLPEWLRWFSRFFNPFVRLQRAIYILSPNAEKPETRVCVREGGEIILSAGAILTPLLLFKSGVGPKAQIEELQLPLVKDIPILGQSISDRVLVPIGMFRNEEPPPSGYPTRICQAIGAKKMGPDCNGFNVGDRNLKCTLATAEELGGHHLGEHIIYSTRFLFPPEYRNHPLIDYLFHIVESCAADTPPLSNLILAPTCALAKPIIDCFRRVIANFYFTAEPKSRGDIHMSYNGDIQVNANYMQQEQDLFDAVRGVSNLIKIANSNVYRGVLQEASESSCPVAVLNSLLDLIAHAGMNQGPSMPQYQTSNLFSIVRQHLEDLIPSVKNGTDTEKARKEKKDLEEIIGTEYQSVDKKLKQRSNNTETCEDQTDVFNYVYRKTCYNKTKKQDANNTNPDATTSIRKFPFNLVEHRSGYPETPDDDDEIIIGNSSRNELLTLFRRYAKNHSQGVETKVIDAKSDNSSDYYTEPKARTVNDIQDRYNIDELDGMGNAEIEDWSIPRSFNQWVASYPPTLPDPDNPVDVAKYVLTYMTSIWHWVGSAPMGVVVDNDLSIIGLDGISIIDASVLNQVTRMNPTATLMMLGRYGAIKRLRKREANQ